MERIQSNPWAARFEPLLDREIIKQRAQVVVSPLTKLHNESTELACKRLEAALKTVFYPTTQCVDVLHRFVDMAYAHCISVYPSGRAFLAGVYAKNSPLSEFSSPLLFTGLAGTGKTALKEASRRILFDEGQVAVDHEHSPFSLRHPWYVSIHARSNPLDVLRELAQSEKGSADLVEKCKKVAFRDGISFLVADEFQFATGSESANARVTQMLLSLGYIGLPWVYNANFSLVGRLLKRPEEDRQRLLADWIILQPDPPSSLDWQGTLRAQKDVAPDVLAFDPIRDASEIHTFTAGRKRAVAKLLVQAYRNEHPRGGVVDISAIKRAYHSPNFASYREESEILANQAIRNCPDKNRKDLWCPLPLPPCATVAFANASKEKRDEQVADAELRSALNGEEMKTLRDIERGVGKSQKKRGEVVPLRRNAALTAEDLKRNANWFKDQL